mmetsp:Transcript_21928/g.70598  ORF Transcript_21928/g.70598 Transcript_21928/m.70598 type:complete len:167 (+) Transcript_21928:168-668(+)
MAWERPSTQKVLNVWGALLSILMALSGCLLCSTALRVSEAREFMIGIYMAGFGVFSFVIECRRFEGVVRWMPFLDTYFGKGAFFVFWGFLLFDDDVGWQILAVIYLASGLILMGAHLAYPTGVVHFSGDDKFADTKAAEAISNYERDASSQGSSVRHPNDHGDDTL